MNPKTDWFGLNPFVRKQKLADLGLAQLSSKQSDILTNVCGRVCMYSPCLFIYRYYTNGKIYRYLSFCLSVSVVTMSLYFCRYISVSCRHLYVLSLCLSCLGLVLPLFCLFFCLLVVNILCLVRYQYQYRYEKPRERPPTKHSNTNPHPLITTLAQTLTLALALTLTLNPTSNPRAGS